jgi:hypothetical protein
MTDDSEYDREFGTPRPRCPEGGEDAATDAADAAAAIDAAQTTTTALLLLKEEARKSIAEFRIKFTQAANSSAAAIKRRRSPHSRTFYNIAASPHVKRAIDNLETENDKIPEESRRLPKADIGLLARAIQNCRLRLIVHDSQSRDELKQQYTQTQKDEVEAEEVMKKAMSSSTTDVDGYLRAKDRHQDAKIWRMDISNELTRTEPKYNKQTGELDNAGVPSQHAQIPAAAGLLLRNILSPETIRRRFISLETLTRQIRNDVAAFLSDVSRHNDRMEVIRQIKESKKKN